MTNKYDDVDWHVEGAVQAGQPEENAFTHIGLYLAWLIGHGMHDPGFIAGEWAAAVVAGEMSGSDLSDAVDGKLVSDAINAEGRAFTDFYYETYLRDYAEAFSIEANYAVVDDRASYARIAHVIDRRYREWVESGRPTPGNTAREQRFDAPDDFDLPGSARLSMSTPAMDLLDSDAAAMDAKQARAAAHGWIVESAPGFDEMPHEAPHLESLIPIELTSPPMQTSSTTASEWRSSMLNRALKTLGVRPRDVFVVNALGGTGTGTQTVSLCSVPGVRSELLAEAFRLMFRVPGARTEERDVGGKLVRWSAVPEFLEANWTRDGLVISASAQDEPSLEALIARLP